MTYSRLFLKSLSVEAFRGFRDKQSFDLSGSAIIVTGPNGTGKTSFFDALQWVLVGSLDRLADLRARRNVEYVVNQYRLGRKASVELVVTLPEGDVRIRRVGDQSGSTLEINMSHGETLFGMEAEKELRRLLLPESEISLESALSISGLLQQDVLRNVLEAKPSDRFQQLSTLLGLRALEEFENELNSAVKLAMDRESQSRSQRDQLAALLENTQERLRQDKARLANRPDVAVVRDEALEILRNTPANLLIDFSTLDLSARESVQSAAAVLGHSERELEEIISRTNDSRETLQSLGAEDPEALDSAQLNLEERNRLKEEASRVRGAAQSELNIARQTAADISKLAAMAIPLLSSDCPVCGQSINREHVEQELLTRAEASETLVGLEKAFVEASDAYNDAASEADLALRNLAEIQRRYELRLNANNTLSETTHSVFSIFEGISFLRLQLSNPSLLMDELLSMAEYIRRSRRVLHDLLGTFDRQKEQGSIDRSEAEVMGIKEKLTTAESLCDRENERLKSMRELQEATLKSRLEVTESRLRSVQPLVADIYQRLDPHPAFKTVEFELDTYYKKGTTSPLVTDRATNISADPLLIFSTSQANIVALSYFLAMSLSMGKKGLPFLLLDDPIQSMDDINVLGFADLSRHILANRQLIVSTHEKRFASLLERKLAPRDAGQKMRIIRFTGWDRSGPTVEERVFEGRSREDRLKLLRLVS